MSGALFQIVGNAPPRTEEGSTTATLWGPAGTRVPTYTVAAKDIVAHPLQRPQRDRVLRFAVNRSGDLMSDVWYEMTGLPAGTEFDAMDDLVEMVEYTIGGQTLERFSGCALEAILSFDACARPSRRGTSIVVPLRLCTGAAGTHTCLPLISLRFHEVAVVLRLSEKAAGIAGAQHRLHVGYVVLDHEERRAIAQSAHVLSRLTRKWSLQPTRAKAGPATHIVPLGLDCTVRDLVVTIRPPPVEVRRLALELRVRDGLWQERQAWGSEALHRDVLPRQLYGLEAPADDVFFLPFDPVPLADVPTGGFNMRSVDARLVVEIGGDDDGATPYYDVHVLARCIGDVKISHGMASFLSPVRPPPTATTSQPATSLTPAVTGIASCTSRTPKTIAVPAAGENDATTPPDAP